MAMGWIAFCASRGVCVFRFLFSRFSNNNNNNIRCPEWSAQVRRATHASGAPQAADPGSEAAGGAAAAGALLLARTSTAQAFAQLVHNAAGDVRHPSPPSDWGHT